MSTRALLIICILMLVNAMVTGIFLSGAFQGAWFSILISTFLLVFLVGILFDSRKVKPFKVSREKIILGEKVVKPDELLRITITHKQIELTQAENMNFRKLLLIRVVNSEELKSLTEKLLDFANENGITIENQI